jgi:E3 ubiquitin-protein ligase RNF14
MDDDQRLVEIETLEAIYPEISRIRHEDGEDALIFEIEVPVKPAAPVAVMFPAAATGNDVATSPAGLGEPSSGNGNGNGSKDSEVKVDSLEISHLPSLRLRISLPLGYPERQPPAMHISAVPPWLRRETLAGLEQDGPRLWEEAGRDMVAFTYIDHVQRLADDVFGAVGRSGALEIDSAHKLAVLDYDINAKKAAFENDTFDCGVCLGGYYSR